MQGCTHAVKCKHLALCVAPCVVPWPTICKAQRSLTSTPLIEAMRMHCTQEFSLNDTLVALGESGKWFCLTLCLHV
jgi:hypothetical protein